MKEYFAHGASGVCLFLFLDRLYQFVRFGSWTSTYMRLQANEQRKWDPTLPGAFRSAGTGLRGACTRGCWVRCLSTEKSIFVFDPLFGLALVLTAVLWRKMTAVLRAYAVAMVMLLAAYMVLYARYFAWAGDLRGATGTSRASWSCLRCRRCRC